MRPAEDDDSLWVTLLPIHNGEAFGLAGRLILLVGGLGLAALAVDIVKTQLPQGRVASVRPAEDDDSLWVTLLPIHNGEAFGLAGRLILLVGGLGLAALAVTGPIMWLQKKAKP
jgi:uncharacterized iron-regulated membrane protein